MYIQKLKKKPRFHENLKIKTQGPRNNVENPSIGSHDHRRALCAPICTHFVARTWLALNILVSASRTPWECRACWVTMMPFSSPRGVQGMLYHHAPERVGHVEPQ